MSKQKPFENFGYSKLKVPVQFKANKKAKTYQTFYRGANGRRVSKETYYKSFVTDEGYTLLPSQVDLLIEVVKNVNDAGDIYKLFKTQLNDTQIYTAQSHNVDVNYKEIEQYTRHFLQTEKSTIEDKALQMGYLHTLQFDAIEAVQKRFKSEVDILEVSINLDISKDTAKVGDYIYILVYGKSRKVGKNKTDKMGKYRYNIKIGTINKIDINDYWG